MKKYSTTGAGSDTGVLKIQPRTIKGSVSQVKKYGTGAPYRQECV